MFMHPNTSILQSLKLFTEECRPGENMMKWKPYNFIGAKNKEFQLIYLAAICMLMMTGFILMQLL
jgi:hypothetical protein